MKFSVRSLRVRLGLLYSIFMMTSMAGLGFFSYWNIERVIASSRQATMIKREERVVAFIDKWPEHDTSLSLEEKLAQLSMAVAETDPIQIYDLRGNLLYSSPSPEILASTASSSRGLPRRHRWNSSSRYAPCCSVVRCMVSAR